MRIAIAALSFCLTVLAAPLDGRAVAQLATDNAPTVNTGSFDKGSCVGILDAKFCDQGVALSPPVQAKVDAKMAERKLARATVCAARVYVPLFRPDPSCDRETTTSVKRDLAEVVHALFAEARTLWRPARA